MQNRCLLEAERRQVPTVEGYGLIPDVPTYAGFLIEAISAQPFDVVDHWHRFLRDFNELVNEVRHDLAGRPVLGPPGANPGRSVSNRPCPHSPRNTIATNRSTCRSIKRP